MGYEFNFGAVGSVPPARAGKGSEVFRLAILGDFSARANRGEVAVGDDLAARKPLRVDVDNLDDVLQRLGVKLQLDIGGEEGTIEVELNSLDAFQPDELYDNLEIFSQLAGLRQRLLNRSTFAKAAQEVQSWQGLALPEPGIGHKPKPRGTVLATDCKLSDFARLTERTVGEERQEVSIAALLRQVVAPHVIPAKDPKQDVLVAAVDAAVSDMMRRVLHHPDFQATEALWRSVDMLIRRLETGVNLKIVLFDLTAEELAADLSTASNLEETGLYKLLVEQPVLDAQQGPVSAIVGNYLFEQTPPHAELLGRMAKIAAAAQAPFIASISTECLKKVDPDDVPALIADSWAALKALPEAVYVALTVPRFLLRNPYGQRTEPIERFAFEEFTPQYGVRGMLWGHSSILSGLLLGLTFAKQGFQEDESGLDPERRGYALLLLHRRGWRPDRVTLHRAADQHDHGRLRRVATVPAGVIDPRPAGGPLGWISIAGGQAAGRSVGARGGGRVFQFGHAGQACPAGCSGRHGSNPFGRTRPGGRRCGRRLGRDPGQFWRLRRATGRSRWRGRSRGSRPCGAAGPNSKPHSRNVGFCRCGVPEPRFRDVPPKGGTYFLCRGTS